MPRGAAAAPGLDSGAWLWYNGRIMKNLRAKAVSFVLIASSAVFAEHQVSITQLDLSNATCDRGKAPVGAKFDGSQMRVGGRTLWGGNLRDIGMHANACLVMPLGAGARRVEASCAVDDGGGAGAVVFRILADGKVAAESGPLRRGQDPVRLAADLSGASTCTFEALDGGDGVEGDHADWLDVKFWYEDGKFPPSDVRSVSRQLGILTPPAGPAPRINGPSVLGVRPGSPVLFRLPVTGERPLSLAAKNLPAGLSFDPASQILSGAVSERGDYRIVFSASNGKGSAERVLTLKVGDAICLTPAMGWNSWNAFGEDVSEEKVMAAADALVASGLADHGWTYVNIDDCWQNNQDNPKRRKVNPDFVGPARLADGTIATNRRFPDMKRLADYVHGKGLKFGLYSSPGPYTCAGHTGSFGHEERDARTFAEWGCDFLKYDWCTYGEKAFGYRHWRWMAPYWVMGRALAHQRRDIVFSLCEYGCETPGLWGNLVYGHSWRTTGDVLDLWASVSSSIDCQKPLFPFSRPGAFNDPDMLCVGPVRFNDFEGSRLAPNEQYTHISLWVLVASPLMIGCDMTKLDDFTIALLSNDEVIAIDQDPLGAGAGCVAEGDEWEIWARPLADGAIAAGLYNKSVRDQTIVLDMDALGIECKWKVRDVWRQEDEGVFLGKYERSVPGHATHLVRLTPLPCGHLREGMSDIRDNAWRLVMKKNGAPPEFGASK